MPPWNAMRTAARNNFERDENINFVVVQADENFCSGSFRHMNCG